MSDDLILATNTSTPRARSLWPSLGIRRWLAPLLLLVLLAVVWEGAKAIFGISDQKLPHVIAILSEFGTRTRGGAGPILALTMLQNAGVTFGEALLGFALGGLLGCVLAVIFASSQLLERKAAVGSDLIKMLTRNARASNNKIKGIYHFQYPSYRTGIPEVISNFKAS